MAFENLFLRTKRTISGSGITVQLDSVIIEGHDSTVRPTKNPVEDGVDITDHAIIEPRQLYIQGIMTDTPLGIPALGQLVDTLTGLFGTSTSSNITRSQQAYNLLRSLQDIREPLSVFTKLQTYNNMIITRVSTAQDKDSSRSVLVELFLEEIIITESLTVRLSEADVDSSVRKSITSTVDRGRQEPVTTSGDTNVSIAKTVSEWLFGG